MDIFLSADDVFEIAERIERNSGEFYIRASQLAGFGRIASTLRELAEMEAQHVKDFAAMRARLADNSDFTLPLNAQSETAAYLNALVSGKFFRPDANPLEYLMGSKSPSDVLMAAIGLEKETITFYLAVKEIVSRDDREIVDRIMKEEMNHVSMLTGQLVRPGT